MEIKEIVSKLDYSLVTAAERVELVNTLMAQLSGPVTQKHLNFTSDYLVYGKTEEDIALLSSSREQRIRSKENELKTVDNIPQLNNINPKKQKIKEVPVPEMDEAIDYIKKLPATDMKQTKLIKKTLRELKQNKFEIIQTMQNITHFCRVQHSTITFLNADLIALTNIKHVKAILNLYSKLKQDSMDKLNGDTKYLLWEMEDLIDTALTLEEKDILMLKLDGLDYLTITNKLCLSKTYVQNCYVNIIPNKITQQAIFNKNIAEAKLAGTSFYKCRCCNKLLPATAAFFHKDYRNAGGFKTICIKCRSLSTKTRSFSNAC